VLVSGTTEDFPFLVTKQLPFGDAVHAEFLAYNYSQVGCTHACFRAALGLEYRIAAWLHFLCGN
jgi:hypothetical protein